MNHLENLKVNFFFIGSCEEFRSKTQRLRATLSRLGTVRPMSPNEVCGIAQLFLKTELNSNQVLRIVNKLNLGGRMTCKEEEHEEMSPA